MTHFLQDLYLLEDLPFLIVILHQCLVYSLNSNNFSSEFMDTQRNLSEGTLTYELHKLVVVDTRYRNLCV